MSTMHIIMMDKNISNANKTTLMKDIEKVDGVKWAFWTEQRIRCKRAGFHDPERCQRYAAK